MKHIDAFLGKNISAARREARLSTSELARSIGLSDPELRNIEHGSRRAGAKEIYRIAKQVGVDIYRLFDTDNHVNIRADCSETTKIKTQNEILSILKNLRLNKTLRDLRELSNIAASKASGAHKAA